MINQSSINAVNVSSFSSQFRKPLYDSYCFSNIPQTIISALTESQGGLPADVLGELPSHYNKVILFFIDAFGWRFFERYQDKYPILQKLADHGVISKLTSQFPSTTAAHVTTMNTGLSVGQHGLYEWNYYEPTLDAVIQPLLYSYAGETVRETLVTAGVDPRSLFPHENIHQLLSKSGIASHVYQSSDYAASSYGEVVMKGSTIHPFASLGQAFTELASQVLADEKGFYYFYFGAIDTIGHKYGPDSPEFEKQVGEFLVALEKLFTDQLQGKLKNTLFLMTADHGQVNSDPEHCFYINKELPEIVPMLQTLKNGKPIIAAGSPRDFFLHVKPEYIEKVVATLSSALKGRAEVYLVSRLIEEKFFGPKPLSEIFLSRVGNVVILPYANQSVWWFEEGVFWQKHIGHHGGLTPEEMETILYAYSFN
jgi:hypothetical protein